MSRRVGDALVLCGVWLHNPLIANMQDKDKIFLYGLLLTGIAVQIITFVLIPGNPWSLVSGILGICSVVLCSQGNILTFFFGFGQILTYTYLCYLERFYAGMAMNAFYFASQIYGIYAWMQRLTYKDARRSVEVVPRRLSWKVLAVIAVATALAALAAGWLLDRYTADTQPYLDAFTTVPAVVAQILMILAYREQWFVWLFIDGLYVVLWLRAENYCMVAQYAFWCINCLYGFRHWSRRIRSSVPS